MKKALTQIMNLSNKYKILSTYLEGKNCNQCSGNTNVMFKVRDKVSNKIEHICSSCLAMTVEGKEETKLLFSGIGALFHYMLWENWVNSNPDVVEKLKVLESNRVDYFFRIWTKAKYYPLNSRETGLIRGLDLDRLLSGYCKLQKTKKEDRIEYIRLLRSEQKRCKYNLQGLLSIYRDDKLLDISQKNWLFYKDLKYVNLFVFNEFCRLSGFDVRSLNIVYKEFLEAVDKKIIYMHSKDMDSLVKIVKSIMGEDTLRRELDYFILKYKKQFNAVVKDKEAWYYYKFKNYILII